MKREFWIEVVRLSKLKIVSDKELNLLVQKAISQLAKKDAGLAPLARAALKQATSLTVVFVEKDRSLELNHQFRNKAYATDVLSFAPIEPGSLGELVFCAPILKTQSIEHKLNLRDEFTYLLIHGVLHLLGYDHEKNDKEATEMYRLQDGLFELLRTQPQLKKRVQNGHRNRTVRRKK